MGWNDDTCDYCGGYIDPIGGDAARLLPNGKYWDGQCRQGRDAQYGHLTNDKLRDTIAQLTHYLEDHPVESTPNIAALVDSLRVSDTLQHLEHLLAEREAQDDKSRH